MTRGPAPNGGARARAARLLAGLAALAAWAGLGVQFAATLRLTGSVASTAWVLLGYFTILTNMLVAALATALAVRGPAAVAPRWVAGATLVIVLVGVVYWLLLRGLLELSGGALLADRLLHTATPILMPLAWIADGRRGALTRTDPLRWALFPLAYFGYALVRGGATGRYAYPFLDVGAIGPLATARNAVLIALGFVAAGYALVAVDRRLARGGGRRTGETA